MCCLEVAPNTGEQVINMTTMLYLRSINKLRLPHSQIGVYINHRLIATRNPHHFHPNNTPSYTEKPNNKIQFGELGHKPMNLMPKCIKKKPYIDDDLRLGTTQMTRHIPGYKGFLSAARTYSNAYNQS